MGSEAKAPQTIARCNLIQVCSLSTSECNWNLYSYIYTKVHNRLKDSRMEDLVCIYAILNYYATRGGQGLLNAMVRFISISMMNPMEEIEKAAMVHKKILMMWMDKLGMMEFKTHIERIHILAFLLTMTIVITMIRIVRNLMTTFALINIRDTKTASTLSPYSN